MVLLWDTGLALLDIRQEEATRYLTVQPKAQLDFTSREQPADRPAGVVQEPDQTQPVAAPVHAGSDKSNTAQPAGFRLDRRPQNGQESLVIAHGALVVLPAASRFLLSDVGRLQPLLPRHPSDAFHCIVLDPPWENASVRRGGQYAMLPAAKLLKIPVPSLLHQDGGLVVLWMTNRERLHRFVEDRLLPAWGLELIATWWWAKITPTGDPIQPLSKVNAAACWLCGVDGSPDSQWRQQNPIPRNCRGGKPPGRRSRRRILASQRACKWALMRQGASHHHPYEPILLAWRRGCSQWPEMAGLPRHLVLAAEPVQHSRKPHLGPVLQLCLPPAPSCLEMFARELIPGWTSWGNDVLHFQSLERFTVQ
ncbi:hypothetical protein WJX84_007556 [Apatococcus fuscideae]|uniref:Uncharacterized protein n=1 Tax=Apatococcus fuscideae TaxID=2026836 RepID=A0AAW1T7W9_9CHLO